MTVKLLTEQNLEFLSFKGVCTGSPESTLVKIPHCWKSLVVAHIVILQCSPEFNFDTQYGRLALRTMYHHISKV